MTFPKFIFNPSSIVSSNNLSFKVIFKIKLSLDERNRFQILYIVRVTSKYRKLQCGPTTYDYYTIHTTWASQFEFNNIQTNLIPYSRKPVHRP